MNNHRLFFYIMLASVCIISCISVPVVVNTVTPTISTSTPSLTPIPSITFTPTITFIPTPEGAGLVNISVDVQFHIQLEELPPGEYLIFRVLEDSSPTYIKYRYVSLDGQQSGDLFTIISPLAPHMLIDYSSGSDLGFYWNRSDTSGILFLDLKTQQVKQFDLGCAGYFSSSVPQLVSPGGHYLAFSCDDDERNRVWHVVSMDNWNIKSYILPATLDYAHYYQFKWVTDNLALLRDDYRAAPSENVCTLQITQGLVNCFDGTPYWIEPTSLVSPGIPQYVVDGGVEPCRRSSEARWVEGVFLAGQRAWDGDLRSKSSAGAQ